MDGHDQRTAMKQTSSRAIATRAAQWRRWQKEADSIWKAHPNLSRHSVARLVKKRLEATSKPTASRVASANSGGTPEKKRSRRKRHLFRTTEVIPR